MPAKASQGKAPGFDIAPPSKPRPAGLSPQQKAMLALGLLAVLGAAAFVADWLTAKDGYTPASGYEKLEDAGSPAQAQDPGQGVVPTTLAGNATTPAPRPGPEGPLS